MRALSKENIYNFEYIVSLRNQQIIIEDLPCARWNNISLGHAKLLKTSWHYVLYSTWEERTHVSGKRSSTANLEMTRLNKMYRLWWEKLWWKGWLWKALWKELHLSCALIKKKVGSIGLTEGKEGHLRKT